MGTSGSREGDDKVADTAPLAQQQHTLALHCREVSRRVKVFRQRCGDGAVCRQLHVTWVSNVLAVQAAWKGLTVSARHALLANVRRMVLVRARSLTVIIAGGGRGGGGGSGAGSSGNEDHCERRVRRNRTEQLLELCCGELSDADWMVHSPTRLLALVQSTLEHNGSEDVPEDLVEDVERACRDSDPGGGEIDGGKEGGRGTLRSLLSIPRGDATLSPAQRASLVLSVVSSLRNAFLVNFAVLCFSELFDDPHEVFKKYAFTEEDTEEDEAEDAGTSPGSAAQRVIMRYRDRAHSGGSKAYT